MDYIQKWALCLCGLSIAGSILFFLIPEGGVGQAVKTVFSLLLLSALFLPILKMEKNEFPAIAIEEAEVYPEEYEVSIREQLAIAGEESIRRTVGNIIEAEYTNEYEIMFATDILSDGSIDIKQMTLVLKRNGNTAALDAALLSLGIPYTIVFSEEGESAA